MTFRTQIAISCAATVAIFVAGFIFFAPMVDEVDGPLRMTESRVRAVGLILTHSFCTTGKFPSADVGLRQLFSDEPGASATTLAIDVWNRPFVYLPQQSSPTKPFLLYSVGKNGVDERGLGDDIDYWEILRKEKKLVPIECPVGNAESQKSALN